MDRREAAKQQQKYQMQMQRQSQSDNEMPQQPLFGKPKKVSSYVVCFVCGQFENAMGTLSLGFCNY
jgi:hypothetical protein